MVSPYWFSSFPSRFLLFSRFVNPDLLFTGRIITGHGDDHDLRQRTRWTSPFSRVLAADIKRRREISEKRLGSSDIRRDVITLGFLIGWRKKGKRNDRLESWDWIVRRISDPVMLFQNVNRRGESKRVSRRGKSNVPRICETRRGPSRVNSSFHDGETRTICFYARVSVRFATSRQISILRQYERERRVGKGERARESNFSFVENQQFFRETSLKSPPRRAGEVPLAAAASTLEASSFPASLHRRAFEYSNMMLVGWSLFS